MSNSALSMIEEHQNKLAYATKYRSDIDGLRAIAVLSVIGYHAFPNLIQGGFIGVDIFFVISGYLIAKIIFQEMLVDNFSLSSFYARRIKRIFPALIIVTLATMILGWNLLPPKEFRSLGINIAGGALFSQNLILLQQVGYFDLAAAKKPLLHLWSLGIEEQYYIVWPILLLGFRKCRLNVITFTVVLAFISYIACVKLLHLHLADQAFYLPYTRAWELLLGAGLAICLTIIKDHSIYKWPERFLEPILQKIFWDTYAKYHGHSTLRHDLSALIACYLIIYALKHFDAHTPYPGSYTLWPVVAAMLLIISSGAWFNRKLLSSRLMVWIGLISYPLYLWHYPLMAYAKIIIGHRIPNATMIGIILLTFILSILTYIFIEKPLRFKKIPYKITFLLISMAIVGGLGLFVYETNGVYTRIPKEIRPFLLTGDEPSMRWRQSTCLLSPVQNEKDFPKNCQGNNGHPLVLIWGDSYATAFAAGLRELKKDNNFDVAEYTASSCPPLVGFSKADRPFCGRINDFVIQEIKKLKPEVVILHSTWTLLDKTADEALKNTITKLKALRVPKIILLGPVPTWNKNGLSENVLDYYYQASLHQLIPERTKYRLNSRIDDSINQHMQKEAEALGVEYISPLNIMCNSQGCLARIGEHGEELTAFDNGHMTLAGATYLVTAILPEVLKG